MGLTELKIKRIVDKEQKKYIRLYEEDKSYGDTKIKVAESLRGDDKVLKKLHSILKKSKTLLDVGCGKGFYTKYLMNTYPLLKVSCIDIAGKMIMRHAPGIDIIQASAHNIPFESRSFDFVMHLDGMEHIPREIENRVLNEELRVSKKYIYHQISTKPTKIDKEWIDKGIGSIHVNIRNEKEWKALFKHFCKDNDLKMCFFVANGNWIHVLLMKRRS